MHLFVVNCSILDVWTDWRSWRFFLNNFQRKHSLLKIKRLSSKINVTNIKNRAFFILFFCYQRTNLDPVSIKYLADIGPSAGDLRLSGCIIRKGRFIFMKERRIIRQKSGCLNQLNERIFQVNILVQGRIKDSWKGVFICIKDVGFALWSYLIYLKCSMKIK